MKKMLKIIGIVLLVLIVGIIAYAQISTYITLNKPRYKDDYYNDFKSDAELELKYTKKGSYKVSHEEIKSDNKSIKNIRIYYPSELKDNNETYPLIMVVNGSQTPAKTYLPFFDRLASWGFIVVGTDDPQSGNGDTASEALDYVLNKWDLKNKIDKDNMGITGYSQGRAGAITAVTKHENGKMYKSMFTGSAAYPALAKMMGWEYDPKDIKISYFMTASTGTSDDQGIEDIDNNFAGVSPLKALIETYESIDDGILKIRARATHAEHEDMLERTDGYMTAWFLYTLTNDEETGKTIIGEDAEILNNSNWQDIEKTR